MPPKIIDPQSEQVPERFWEGPPSYYRKPDRAYWRGSGNWRSNGCLIDGGIGGYYLDKQAADLKKIQGIGNVRKEWDRLIPTMSNFLLFVLILQSSSEVQLMG